MIGLLQWSWNTRWTTPCLPPPAPISLLHDALVRFRCRWPMTAFSKIKKKKGTLLSAHGAHGANGQKARARARTHARTHTHTRARMHARTHARTRARCAHTHAHTRTHNTTIVSCCTHLCAPCRSFPILKTQIRRHLSLQIRRLQTVTRTTR